MAKITFLIWMCISPSMVMAQGIVGGLVEGLCGGCGAGEALDGLHDDLGKPLDVPFRVFNESQVEILGPILGEAIRHSRNEARAAGTNEIPDEIRFVLNQFFDESVQSSVRYRIGSNHELSVATNSIRLGDANAVALIDTIIFRSEVDAADQCLWVHEMKHVEQFLQWGETDFGKRYVRSLGSSDGAVEGPAYQLQERCRTELHRILSAYLQPRAILIDSQFQGSWVYLGQYDGRWIEQNFTWGGAQILPVPGGLVTARVDVNIRFDHIRFNTSSDQWVNAQVAGGIRIGQSFRPSQIVDVTDGLGYYWARIGP